MQTRSSFSEGYDLGIAVGFAGGSSRLKIAFRNIANAIGNLKEGWLADFFKRLNHKKGRSTADWTVNTNTNSAQVALVAFLERFNTGVSLAKQADVNTLMSLAQPKAMAFMEIFM